MAQTCKIGCLACRHLLRPAGLLLLLVSPAMGVLLDDFLMAADNGQCIESVTFRTIRDRGPADATEVVKAALEAYGQREHQQRSLGCAGDIAAQAIAAGADPEQVLEATAAGL
ncbi:MAG: hypothetical protein WBN02_05025 [Sedimenticolaceae bacterium]